MALIEETLFGTVDKVHDAIERLRAFEPKDRPYWLAFSGGKDSCVILELAKMAGVNYEAHYSVTSVDPPELVRFIREKYPDVSFDIPHDKNGKPITMWSLIAKNSIPPTRLSRYCCKYLKESNGIGTVTITGVRWAESVRRKENQGVVTFFGKKAKDVLDNAKTDYIQTKKGAVVLNDDNDEARRAVEVCFRTHKTMVNPIIDWKDDDVWEFIHSYNIPYCSLYDKGYKRLGCIGCPMGGSKQMQEQFKEFPKYKENYIRAFKKMVNGINRSDTKFHTAEDVMNWWIGVADKTDSEERSLFDDYDEDY